MSSAWLYLSMDRRRKHWSCLTILQLHGHNLRTSLSVCACVVTCFICMILTLIVVVKQPFGAFFLCFFLGCAQFSTFWYYMLSYIPFGRKGARKLCDALMKKVTT